MAEGELELARRLEQGDEVVLATVIRLDGEPPSRAGAKALFDAGRQLAGTLGCSEFDSQARADAPGLLSGGEAGGPTSRHELGSIAVSLHPSPPRPLLVVLGDTPVAAALRTWAPEVGFDVATSPPEGSSAADLYVGHTDHDDPDLVAALERLFARRPRFVGLVGSRRHTGHHLEALRERGLPEGEIAQIQSPVGLDLGGPTPPEIALSILAGLVTLRRGGAGGWKDAPRGPRPGAGAGTHA